MTQRAERTHTLRSALERRQTLLSLTLAFVFTLLTLSLAFCVELLLAAFHILFQCVYAGLGWVHRLLGLDGLFCDFCNTHQVFTDAYTERTSITHLRVVQHVSLAVLCFTQQLCFVCVAGEHDGMCCLRG